MSVLGGCSEVAENGNIESSNISKDVEQKLKILMVFGWGTRGEILNITKDVEQNSKEQEALCRSIPGPCRGLPGALPGPVQRNARGWSGLLGLTEAE